MVLPRQWLNAKLSQWLSLTQSNPAQFVTAESVDKPIRVRSVAYTGGMVALSSLPLPVVFDLSSTKAASSVVMLYNHDREQPIGHWEVVTITKTEIRVEGPISIDNDKSREVKAAAKNGYPWQASVGIQSDNISYLAEGETATVNGQVFNGPIYIARENVLREVSILTIGADSDTSVSFSANLGNPTMNFEAWVKELGFDVSTLTAAQKTALQGIYDTMMTAGATEQVKAEARAKAIALRATWTPTPPTPPIPPPTVPPVPVDDPVLLIRSRIAAEHIRTDTINAYAREFNNPISSGNLNINGIGTVPNGVNIAATAIRDGWTADQTHIAMLRAARPIIQSGPARQDGVTPWQVLHAGLSQTVRLPRIETHHTPQILDAAHREYRGRLSLQQLIYEAARINGYTGSANVKANLKIILQAAFSTMDLVNVFTNTATNKLLEGYNAIDQTWRQIARITTAVDFKEFSSFVVTGGMTFEKLAPDGMIRHGTLDENGFGNKVETYAKMYAITRQDFYNDNLNVFDSIPRLLGRGGALGLVRAFWVEFMNNAAFFVAGNGNVSTGALSIAGLGAAEAVFRGLKGTDGEYLLSTPRYLLVPTAIFPTAEQLYKDTQVVSGNTTPAPSGNNAAGKYLPLTTPYLSDSTITGNSTTAYYLLADPNDVATIEVAFLDNQQTPIVESADVDFNQLGVQMRGYWDWGVRKQDPKGGVRSTGV